MMASGKGKLGMGGSIVKGKTDSEGGVDKEVVENNKEEVEDDKKS